MVNEVAAVGIGKYLTDSSTSSEDKATLKKELASFENEKFAVVYQQNTADVVNVVVPDYDGFEAAMVQALKDSALEQVSGGEIGLTLSFFFGWVGIGIAGAVGATGVLAGGATGAAAIAIGAVVVSTTVVVGVAAIAGVAAGVGVGIAAGLGAFSGEGDVNIAHNS